MMILKTLKTLPCHSQKRQAHLIAVQDKPCCCINVWKIKFYTMWEINQMLYAPNLGHMTGLGQLSLLCLRQNLFSDCASNYVDREDAV